MGLHGAFVHDIVIVQRRVLMQRLLRPMAVLLHCFVSQLRQTSCSFQFKRYDCCEFYPGGHISQQGALQPKYLLNDT